MDILLVDDHTIIRTGVRNLLLELFPEARITECNTLAGTRQALADRAFALVVLDLMLGDGNAFEHLGGWTAGHPRTRFVVYSMVSAKLYAERVLALGAAAFVSKEGTEAELEASLLQAMAGEEPEEQSVAHVGASGRGLPNPFTTLSDRELMVMHELLRGHGITEIAQRTELSISTVSTYKTRLLDKLGLTSLIELHRFAELHGIVAP